MHFHDIYTHLHTVHLELKNPNSSLEQQTEAINDLFLFVDSSQGIHCPSALSRQAFEIFQWHLDFVLPELGYAPEDQEAVREDYREVLDGLEKSSACVQELEKALLHLIGDLRGGSVKHEREAAEVLLGLARQFTRKDDLFSSSLCRRFGKALQDGPDRKQIFGFLNRVFRLFQQQKIDDPALVGILTNFRQLCEYYAQAYFQGKAVLVDVARQGFVVPLWLQVDQNAANEHVLFEQHDIDAVMQSSSDNARLTACRYLHEHCGQEIGEQVSVRCRFPLPAVGYRDSSASLLLAMQIVGNVLDLDPDATSVVSGEVDEWGNLVKVGWIPEKVEAAARDDSIRRFMLPAANLPDTADRAECDLVLLPVQSFTEALEAYYGDSLQRRLKQLKRRQFLKGMAAFAVTPFLLSGVRNFFLRPGNPVNECDWRLLETARELYQQESNYRHAVTILESILTRFQREESSTEGIRIQAFALGQLGVIHLQQQQMQDSLRVLKQAAALWEQINDKENQADVLLRIGEVYRYSVAMDGIGENARRGLDFYRKAHALLRPSMQLYKRLEGRFFALSGYMHYWNGEYEQAEKLGRQALTIFEEPESNWSYQTARQHLARTLIANAQYDEAQSILQSGSELSCLQGPHDKARNALAFSELYFSLGDESTGREYAERASALCRDFGLQGQQRILTRSLKRFMA